MTTNTTGFIDLTKEAARDAVVGYFQPLVSLIRLFQPLWMDFRLAVLEFRATRNELSLRESLHRMMSRIWGYHIPMLESGSDAESIISAIDVESAIRTLQDTAAFLEQRKSARIDLAVAAQKKGDASLRKRLFLELQVIEIERLAVEGRLARARYRESVRLHNNVQPEQVNVHRGEIPRDAITAMHMFEDITHDMARLNITSANAQMRSLINSALELGARSSQLQ